MKTSRYRYMHFAIHLKGNCDKISRQRKSSTTFPTMFVDCAFGYCCNCNLSLLSLKSIVVQRIVAINLVVNIDWIQK